MPQSAIANVSVDFRLRLRDIPGCLVHLVEQARRRAGAATRAAPPTEDVQDHPIGQPMAMSCPECGGAMRRETLGPLTRFRCHIGHVMTAEVLAAAQILVLENQLAATLRLLNERAALCREIAEKEKGQGEAASSAAWLRAAREAARREEILMALTETEWTHPEVTLEGQD